LGSCDREKHQSCSAHPENIELIFHDTRETSNFHFDAAVFLNFFDNALSFFR